MNLNNFAISHVLRGIMTSSSDGSFMWSINQITEPTLSVTAETSEVVDALGSVIISYDRAKKAEFSASNSLFDLGLFAAQNGTEKEIATAANTVKTPTFEEFKFANISGVESYILKHTPVEPLTKIYTLNGDGTLSTVYTAGTAATADKFVFDPATDTLTAPTGISLNTTFMVIYEYETSNGVSVSGNALDFPKNGKFILEVLGSDVCNPDTLIHAYLIFPNAKLDANVDISFQTDGKHPFKLICAQNYCDHEKKLFQLVIPKED